MHHHDLNLAGVDTISAASPVRGVGNITIIPEGNGSVVVGGSGNLTLDGSDNTILGGASTDLRLVSQWGRQIRMAASAGLLVEPSKQGAAVLNLQNTMPMRDKFTLTTTETGDFQVQWQL